MSQPRIFVSYSRKDEAFTGRLVEDLHRAGAEVWVDVAGISHGNFMAQINEALEHCEWMVLVLTPNAIESDYVRDEVFTALHRVKQGFMRDVIPLLAAQCPPGSIPPLWDARQRYDATQNYSAALAGILNAIGLSNAATSSSPELSAPAQSTKPVDDLLARGKSLIDRAEWTPSIDCYVQVTNLDPRSYSAWANLGRAFAEVGRYAECLVACNRALELNDQSGSPWVNKGRALNGLKRYDEALAAYDQALSINPKYVVALTNKAGVLLTLGRNVEALQAASQALANDPNYARAWNAKGKALHVLHRDEEALEAYDCALAAEPKYVDAWKRKAVSLRALGREADAQKAERQAKDVTG